MKKIIYIWCCDKNINSGEGILANKFLKDFKYYNKEFRFKIKNPNKNKIIFLRKLFGVNVDRFVLPFFTQLQATKFTMSKQELQIVALAKRFTQ